MVERHYSQIAELTLPELEYVLVIPGWYPTKQDSFLGDFNQRQVLAAGLFMPQVVLYITKDLSKKLTSIETSFVQKTENIVEITVIYPAKNNRFFDAIYSNYRYVRLLYKYAESIRKQWGKPKLLHAYIAVRGGLGSLLLSKKWKLPFIISEHWTIYYPEDPGYLQRRNFLFKKVVKTVFASAAHVLPVSQSLQKQVEKFSGNKSYAIVPNVVDTGVFSFEPEVEKAAPRRFIHVSTMTYQKNPDGILRGFKKFIAANPGCCLWMVGPCPDEVVAYARELGLEDNTVHFTGPVTYEEVAALLKESVALVLFSRYENLPCVILEALCCGLPLISTNVGGIAEVINVENGILVDNEEQLSNAFEKIYKSHNDYDHASISCKASKLYNYKTIGRLISDVYNQY
jgi:glycosyltransferase involved in cell wall biosynthesis